MSGESISCIDLPGRTDERQTRKGVYNPLLLVAVNKRYRGAI